MDWSGDAGDPGLDPKQNPWLVLAVVHVESDNMPDLVAAVAEVHRVLGDDSPQPFKHQRAAQRAEQAFFSMVSGFPLEAHVKLVDKRLLGPPARGPKWGWDRIRDAAIDLVLGCPDRFVRGQCLLVDLPRSENRLVDELRTGCRQALRPSGRSSFRKVKGCPDHKPNGELIQVADMIAGEFRQHGGVAGLYLPRLAGKVVLV